MADILCRHRAHKATCDTLVEQRTLHDGSARSWQVDLGKLQTIGFARIAWELAYTEAYSVEGSADGKPDSWRTLYASTTGKGGV